MALFFVVPGSLDSKIDPVGAAEMTLSVVKSFGRSVTCIDVVALRNLLVGMAFAITAGTALPANALPIFAGNAVLSGYLTSDNEFAAYLSTSDSTLGTLVTFGNDWTQAYNFNTILVPGQNYYLHIIADNFFGPSDGGGNPDALLGSFSLTGSGHKFSTGAQTLVTNVANWAATSNATSEQIYPNSPPPVNPTWILPTGTPIFLAQNGGGIWGSVHGGPVIPISLDANWIWSSSDPTGESFFSTPISAVPEPATWVMLLVGFGMLGSAMRRRSQAAAIVAA